MLILSFIKSFTSTIFIILINIWFFIWWFFITLLGNWLKKDYNNHFDKIFTQTLLVIDYLTFNIKYQFLLFESFYNCLLPNIWFNKLSIDLYKIYSLNYSFIIKNIYGNNKINELISVAEENKFILKASTEQIEWTTYL